MNFNCACIELVCVDHIANKKVEILIKSITASSHEYNWQNPKQWFLQLSKTQNYRRYQTCSWIPKAGNLQKLYLTNIVLETGRIIVRRIIIVKFDLSFVFEDLAGQLFKIWWKLIQTRYKKEKYLIKLWN